MKFLLSLLCALCFVPSQGVAVDIESTAAASTTAAKEESQHATPTRRSRVRQTVAVDASSPLVVKSEVVDPFNNYMVLAENEDALLRALKDKVSSVPPPYSVSSTAWVMLPSSRIVAMKLF